MPRISSVSWFILSWLSYCSCIKQIDLVCMVGCMLRCNISSLYYIIDIDDTDDKMKTLTLHDKVSFLLD